MPNITYTPEISLQSQWQDTFKSDPTGKDALELLKSFQKFGHGLADIVPDTNILGDKVSLAPFSIADTNLLNPKLWLGDPSFTEAVPSPSAPKLQSDAKAFVRLKLDDPAPHARAESKLNSIAKRATLPIIGLLADKELGRFKLCPPPVFCEMEGAVKRLISMRQMVAEGNLKELELWGKETGVVFTASGLQDPFSSRADSIWGGIKKEAYGNASFEAKVDSIRSMNSEAGDSAAKGIFASALTTGDAETVKVCLAAGVDPNGTINNMYPLTYSWAMGAHHGDVKDTLIKGGASERLYLSQRQSPEFAFKHLKKQVDWYSNKTCTPEAAREWSLLVGKSDKAFRHTDGHKHSVDSEALPIALVTAAEYGLEDVFDNLLASSKAIDLTDVATRCCHKPKFVSKLVDSVDQKKVKETLADLITSRIKTFANMEPSLVTFKETHKQFLEEFSQLPKALTEDVLASVARGLSSPVTEKDWKAFYTLEGTWPGLGIKNISFKNAEYAMTRTDVVNKNWHGTCKAFTGQSVTNLNTWLEHSSRLVASGLVNIHRETGAFLDKVLDIQLAVTDAYSRTLDENSYAVKKIDESCDLSRPAYFRGCAVYESLGVATRTNDAAIASMESNSPCKRLCEIAIADNVDVPWARVPTKITEGFVHDDPAVLRLLEPSLLCGYTAELAEHLASCDPVEFVSERRNYVGAGRASVIDYVLDEKTAPGKLLEAVVDGLESQDLENILVARPTLAQSKVQVITSAMSTKNVALAV